MRYRDGNGHERRGASRCRPTWALLACVLTAACSGCGLLSGSAAAPTAAPATTGHVGHVTSHPSSAPSCPDQVFSRLSEAQRVGQLFLVGIAGDPISDVAQAVDTYHFGSLLFTGDSAAGTAEIADTTSAVQSLASSAATAQVRFFIAANQEGGQVQQLQGPGFAAIPPALAQGQLLPSVLQQQAETWGRELRLAGINLDLAPVMDVVPAATASENQPIGALQREFGYDPDTVASHGLAFISGMQQAGVATTAKHFPGLGRVLGNTDFTADVIDTVTGSDSSYLQSFQSAINAGVPFVMIALATYTRIDPDHLAAFSSRVMRGLLRDQMHFKGVIVSDDLGSAAAVAGISPASRGIDFLAAGGDLITSQSLGPAEVMDQAILAQAADDSSFRATVNSAVRRILAAKQAYHLMSCH